MKSTRSRYPTPKKQYTKEQWLMLLDLLQLQLGKALDSLGGKHLSLHQHFEVYSAVHINRSAQGYVVLRKAGLSKASVLLVRTAIEAMFRLQAVKSNPALICQIAYGESLEERKMVRALPQKKSQKLLLRVEKQWAQFKKSYIKKFPAHQFVEKPITVADVAKAANLESVYATHYRLYCKHTHATFRATTGGFGDNPLLDDPTAVICVIAGIETAIAVGGVAPEFAGLVQKFKEMSG